MPDVAGDHGDLERIHREIQSQNFLGARAPFEERLRKLGSRLSEHMGSVEDFFEEHRLTFARAAFVVVSD